MRTWTNLKNDTASFCNVTTNDTTAMSVIEKNINDSIRTICNIQGGKLRFLEAVKTMTTIATEETYQIPNGFRKLIDMYIHNGTGTSSDTIYAPRMIFDPTLWKRILQTRLGTQEVPYFTYVENKTFKIQPIPSVTGNLMVLRGRLQTRDLSVADYTTGTIASIANGATAIVGSGTTWTADMIGRYIQINDASGGDGFWYEIGTFTSATSIGLVKPYEGVTLAAGSAIYIIGQCSPIPEAYDVGIVYRATALYWDNQGDLTRGKSYWMKYDGGYEAGYTKEIGGLMLQMVTNEGETEEGGYIAPIDADQGINQNFYNPWQQASGF